MNTGSTVSRNRFGALFRPLFGVTFLGIIITWVAKQGALTEKISASLVICSTVASVFITLINAAVIRSIVSAYQGEITCARSLHISALGALGNALGGLPIGTGLKFAILYKQNGLKVMEITSGLIIFTIAISFFLLAYVSASIWAMDFPLLVKAVPAMVLSMGAVLLPLLWLWLKKRNSVARLVRPFLRGNHLERLLLISFSMATSFLLNYWIIGRFLFPEIPFMQMIFITSLGILTGLGSLLQSVGGIQEISMGIATLMSGAGLIDGAQIALFMRITSLASSSLLLALLYLLPREFSCSKHT